MPLRRALLPLLCAAILLSSPASAHPGRTDANGGHYNRSTGEYHYHHGYLAHQHIDGVCPYNFDDRTGRRSYSAPPPSDSLAQPPPEPKPLPEESEQSEIPKIGWILLFLCGICALGIIVDLIGNEISACKSKIQTRRAERNKYKALYGGKSAESLCAMPNDTEIGPDGLPKEKGADDWGEKYTVYCSKTGKVYHRKGCSAAATIKIHAFRTGRRTPCKKCKPEVPDREWFNDYLKIKSLKDKYHIK